MSAWLGFIRSCYSALEAKPACAVVTITGPLTR
jgi:hypothetical protein